MTTKERLVQLHRRIKEFGEDHKEVTLFIQQNRHDERFISLARLRCEFLEYLSRALELYEQYGANEDLIRSKLEDEELDKFMIEKAVRCVMAIEPA